MITLMIFNLLISNDTMIIVLPTCIVYNLLNNFRAFAAMITHFIRMRAKSSECVMFSSQKVTSILVKNVRQFVVTCLESACGNTILNMKLIMVTCSLFGDLKMQIYLLFV